jgi:predicted RNA-binding protein YlxR (DUF448 family)
MKNSRVKTKTQQPRVRHIPERTCVACRRTAGKQDLIRLVCSDGVVEADQRGAKPGRGVYLCLHSECWEKGLQNNRIEFGLRTKLSKENRQSLLEYGRSLPVKEDTR